MWRSGAVQARDVGRTRHPPDQEAQTSLRTVGWGRGFLLGLEGHWQVAEPGLEPGRHNASPGPPAQASEGTVVLAEGHVGHSPRPRPQLMTGKVHRTGSTARRPGEALYALPLAAVRPGQVALPLWPPFPSLKMKTKSPRCPLTPPPCQRCPVHGVTVIMAAAIWMREPPGSRELKGRLRLFYEGSQAVSTCCISF